MRFNKLLAAVPVAASMAMVSCIDQNYDLSNIDSTIKAEIKDLVVPMNLDDIKMDAVLDLKEDSKIQVYLDQETGKKVYAIKESGTFNSDPVNVNAINITRPNVGFSDAIKINISVPQEARTAAQLYKQQFGVEPTFQDLLNTGVLSSDMKIIDFAITGDKAKSEMSIHANNIDKSIKGIDRLGISSELSIKVKLKGLERIVPEFDIQDLDLVLPAGLVTTNPDYKPNGKGAHLYYATKSVNNGDLDISLDINAIEYAAAHADGANFDSAKHTFDFTKTCMASGEVIITVADINPQTTIADIDNLGDVAYSCNVQFANDIRVESFSGDIDYTVDGLNVDPINMDNIPDFLNQTGTKIGIADPRIYIKVNNPLKSGANAECNISPAATLTITPQNPSAEETFAATVSMPDLDNSFCLSPVKHENYLSEAGQASTSCTWINFANLGNILQGKSDQGYQLPKSIDITIDPKVQQNVQNFHLGSFGKVTGEYIFYAPVDLTSSSTIKYTHTADGWFKDKDDNITVTRLNLTADVTKDVPFGVTCNIYPLDRSGKRIISKQTGKAIVGVATLGADTGKSIPLTMSIDDTIEGLDGVDIDITTDSKSGHALSPNDNINIKNLRVTVSGYYQKKM